MADRRFRVVAVDGGHLAFADLLLHTPSRPPQASGQLRPAKLHSVAGASFSVSAVQPSQQARDSDHSNHHKSFSLMNGMIRDDDDMLNDNFHE